MKAIILTYADVTLKEKKLINDSCLFKVAVNWANYQTDYRVTRDYKSLDFICNRFKEPVILSACDGRKDRFKRAKAMNLYYKGSTLTSAVDFCLNLGYNEILLVANNKVHTEHLQETVKQAINELKAKGTIYQYTKGNFDLPVKSIEDFILCL